MKMPFFVAMLATHNRFQLLFDCSLPSVFGQSRRADRLVLINDGMDTDLAKRLADKAPGADYLENRRTKGLSGALNTGLDHLARSLPNPSEVFVAFLDDDDAWKNNHLAAVDTCIRSGAEIIATPFLRIEPGRESRRVDPPASVTPEIFMAGNPGIQGSNLVVRLDVLLEAGGFNEALASCTDRDLLIRLCRRPGLIYATTPTPSVEHHASSDRERLSQPGSPAKIAGLKMFDQIHGPLMSEETRSAHLDRAERLFAWRPCEGASEMAPPRRPFAPTEAEMPPLLVGIIVDDRRIGSVARLLDDLADLVAAENLEPPDVLLLENRPETASGEALAEMVAQHRTRLRIRVIDRAAQGRLIQSDEWRPEGSDMTERLSIADARTLLQSCLYHMALDQSGCVVWILDDDMRLNPLEATQTGSRRVPLALGTALRRMRATGAEICIGTYTGAPPLSAAACVRVQLLDVIWNLRRLSALASDAPVPTSEPHNSRLRNGRRDYYYDLSRIETDRLETPFALEPAHPGETCGEALQRLSQMIPRILAGEAPLRPLLADPDEREAFATGEAFHRGGNTFIFDPDALADLPNASPTVEGRPTRRSDMIWSLMQARRCGRKVLSVPVPVRQDRSDLPKPEVMDHNGIADDIRGFAIFSAMRQAWGDPGSIEALCLKFEEERLAALRLSFYRVRGLAQELLAWCEDDALPPALTGRLSAQGRDLLRLFSEESYLRIETAVSAMGQSEARSFLDRLGPRVDAHAARVRSAREIPRLLAKERVAAATAAIVAVARPETKVRVLGHGAEGVTVTDGRTAWKLFDRWNPKQAEKAAPVLKGLVDRDVHRQALVRPLSMTSTSTGWLLAIPFEPSDPWLGGHGPGLVELLADLHQAGLVCRNLHPKNLRVADGVVRLIDYGADLLQIEDPHAESLEFMRMCRRAWLCWRWWWRDDLDGLMRLSLHDCDLPELSDHERFIHAVRERLGVQEIPDPTMVRAAELRPTHVLDYGAGKGKQAAALAQAGAEVVAWDPDPGVALRLKSLARDGVRRAASAAEAVAAGPYDLVICRRVACLLDDAALDGVFRDLRSAVAPNGRVLLSLCHPAYAHRVRTAEAEPVSHPCGCRAASWQKRIRSTGRIRMEVHRSERVLRRQLGRAGLRIVGRQERFCTDFERFETVADLLVLELTPAPLPDVSLLVKACAMDAEALESHVQDMLVALEDPGVFRETILALDTRTTGFPRSHSAGDLEALRAAARNLLASGDVDRIVETPSDPAALRALNQRWFGLDLCATHSAGGAATGALLAGFEACTTPRVLHADLDMMIGRTETNNDPVAELSAVLDAHTDAVTASFPVASAKTRPWSADGPEGPWRVESRLGMVDMRRMERMLPLPNDDACGSPRLSWHRALDNAVQQGRGTSLRGGGLAFCVHPPNARKSDIDAWEEVRGAVARGTAPAVQHESIEWTGDLSDWRRAERHEPFVFVICGRDVMPERFRRCWDSVLRQSCGDWGAIVIDDASVPWIVEETARILAPHAARVSFVARRRRAGLLANTSHAVRHLCASPNQVIVTLDADDRLIGGQVIDRLTTAYDGGADLTVGSMLRTDKPADYPVRFDNPRSHRGGNVWQHLRSFRKGFFDKLPDDLLRLDGDYVELASDWAFMVPMVEMARYPVWIHEPLYLHEPGEARDPTRTKAREAVIARLIAREIHCMEASQ
ncbi:MAG: glycosyltransferase [Rhodobacteraceae bacterium]|nr:glycosyltransferase [Paracoccaceae bacterium]